jgi:hypothetical protein
MCCSARTPRWNIVIDPGLGFAKTGRRRSRLHCAAAGWAFKAAATERASFDAADRQAVDAAQHCMHGSARHKHMRVRTACPGGERERRGESGCVIGSGAQHRDPP